MVVLLVLFNCDEDFIYWILWDYMGLDLVWVVVDDVVVVNCVSSFFGVEVGNVLVEFYSEFSELLEYYKVNVVICDVLKLWVDLLFGGYVIIEFIEVFMVIDVNLGLFI